MNELNLEQHRQLVQSLIEGGTLGHSPEQCELIETHISSVIVTPDKVYKLKKPINLGFLNFSTQDRRRHFCHEEFRLNRRLSSDLYLGVIPVYGTVDQPSFDEISKITDYVVVMKPFEQKNQFDHLLQRGELDLQHMNSLADYIADFHLSAPKVDSSEDFGSADHVARPVRENFLQIRQYCDSPKLLNRVEHIEKWSEQWIARHVDRLLDRKTTGFVRECHGDLHCHNLAWYQGKPLAFDCIEFDPALYWIDVISDVAFLLMDLRFQNREDLAQIFLNRYLQVTGDYEGLTLLRFYMVYRAMVRAKIEAITAAQSGIEEKLARQAASSLDQYLDLAELIARESRGAILLMHGPSASGKSTVSSSISQCLSAVTVRSDVERKRLFELDQYQNHSTGFAQGIYNPKSTEMTYQRMLSLSGALVDAGFTVINDATFSRPEQRQLFYDLAADRNCPVQVIDLKVPESILRERIKQRKNDVSDADIHVLEQQLKQWQPLLASEASVAIDVEDQGEKSLTALCNQLKSVLDIDD